MRWVALALLAVSCTAPSASSVAKPSATNQAAEYAAPVEYRFSNGVRCYTWKAFDGSGLSCVVVPGG